MGNQEILLSTIFNESFDAMMILDLSTQRFIMFNKKALEIYNYSEEEFKQISPNELTLEFVSDEKMKEKQKTILDRGWDKFTTKHKTKDGKAIDVLIKSKKIELIQWLSTLNDKTLIDKLMKLREKEKTDWWNEISAKEKESIEKGLEDANSGKLKPHSEIRKKYEKWL